MSYAKLRPFCLGLNVLIRFDNDSHVWWWNPNTVVSYPISQIGLDMVVACTFFQNGLDVIS